MPPWAPSLYGPRHLSSGSAGARPRAGSGNGRNGCPGPCAGGPAAAGQRLVNGPQSVGAESVRAQARVRQSRRCCRIVVVVVVVAGGAVVAVVGGPNHSSDLYLSSRGQSLAAGGSPRGQQGSESSCRQRGGRCRADEAAADRQVPGLPSESSPSEGGCLVGQYPALGHVGHGTGHVGGSPIP
jgi:hypothetical protein